MFLRRFARPLMMMTNVKETTGIVEEVAPNARAVLIDLYAKTLDEVKTIPEKEAYRKTVETSTSHRLKVCQEEEDWEKIQERIGSSQEELIKEAKDELRLIGNMHKWKAWGVVDNGPPKPKPKIKTGPLPPEFYQALESVAIKAEENRLKREAEERAKAEAEELQKKETAELTRKLREDLAALNFDIEPPSESSSSGSGSGSV